MMPGKSQRKAAQQPPAPAEQEAITQCSLHLRKVGDKCNLRQKFLNVITKLFCPGT
ncbi:phorbol-12-myristate-13-acetate-induced protein 1 [Emydura macquarii macquarii]|uniref:phorbol-12-myristate-13-acetate-induced protein 1 n=1 Tax=Emydura macquarii macquarii TaxID=1129001 RepID=UPI00352A0724